MEMTGTEPPNFCIEPSTALHALDYSLDARLQGKALFSLMSRHRSRLRQFIFRLNPGLTVEFKQKMKPHSVYCDIMWAWSSKL